MQKIFFRNASLSDQPEIVNAPNTITSWNFSHKTDRYPAAGNYLAAAPKATQSKKGAKVSNYKLGPDPWNPIEIPLRSVDVKLDLL